MIPDDLKLILTFKKLKKQLTTGIGPELGGHEYHRVGLVSVLMSVSVKLSMKLHLNFIPV